jgi:hypothetical protein
VAISYIGGNSGSAAGATSGNTTLNFLSIGGAPAANDLIVIAISISSQGRTPTHTIPSGGFTQIGSTIYGNGTTYDASLSLFYKFADGVETSCDFGPSGNAADGIAVVCQVFRGVDTSTPLDGVSPVTATGAGNARPNADPITPATAGAWIIAAGSGAAASGNVMVEPSAVMENLIALNRTETNDAMLGMGYHSGWTSGAFDPPIYTSGATQAANSWCAITIALRPSGGGSSNGDATGTNLSEAISSSTGAATGAANATGASLTDTVSSSTGAATGDANATGAALVASFALSSGAASSASNGDATGTSLTETISASTGAATGAASATGTALSSSLALSAGAATGAASTVGCALTESVSVSGGASAGTASASGTSQMLSFSVAGGAASSEEPEHGDAPGTSLALSAALASGTAAGAGQATGCSLSISLGVASGEATSTSSIAGCALEISYGVSGGSSSATGANRKTARHSTVDNDERADAKAQDRPSQNYYRRPVKLSYYRPPNYSRGKR